MMAALCGSIIAIDSVWQPTMSVSYSLILNLADQCISDHAGVMQHNVRGGDVSDSVHFCCQDSTLGVTYVCSYYQLRTVCQLFFEAEEGRFSLNKFSLS